MMQEDAVECSRSASTLRGNQDWRIRTRDSGTKISVGKEMRRCLSLRVVALQVPPPPMIFRRTLIFGGGNKTRKRKKKPLFKEEKKRREKGRGGVSTDEKRVYAPL